MPKEAEQRPLLVQYDGSPSRALTFLGALAIDRSQVSGNIRQWLNQFQGLDEKHSLLLENLATLYPQPSKSLVANALATKAHTISESTQDSTMQSSVLYERFSSMPRGCLRHSIANVSDNIMNSLHRFAQYKGLKNNILSVTDQCLGMLGVSPETNDVKKYINLFCEANIRVVIDIGPSLQNNVEETQSCLDTEPYYQKARAFKNGALVPKKSQLAIVDRDNKNPISHHEAIILELMEEEEHRHRQHFIRVPNFEYQKEISLEALTATIDCINHIMDQAAVGTNTLVHYKKDSSRACLLLVALEIKRKAGLLQPEDAQPWVHGLNIFNSLDKLLIKNYYEAMMAS